MTPHFSFPPLTREAALEVLASLGPVWRPPENAGWLVANSNDWANRHCLVSQPWRASWPVCVFYTCCHPVQFLTYWARFQPHEIPFNFVALFNHTFKHEGIAPLSVPFVGQLLKKASFFVTHRAYKGVPDFSETVLAQVASRARVIYFNSPSTACFWPVVAHWGADGVYELARRGFSKEAVKSALDAGDFPCLFEERFRRDMARLEEKDAEAEIKIVPTIQERFRQYKLFWSFNHPTFPFASHIADALLGVMLGDRFRMPESFIWSLPSDGYELRPVFPETRYEWDFYGFQYPRHFEQAENGLEFYFDQIDESWPARI